MFSTLLFYTLSALVATAYGQVEQVEHHGNLRLYEPNGQIGACGFPSQNYQRVVAVPPSVFNNYPGATENPNENPICNQLVRITGIGPSGPVNITARVVDNFGDPNTPDDLLASRAIMRLFNPGQNISIVEDTVWTLQGEVPH